MPVHFQLDATAQQRSRLTLMRLMIQQERHSEALEQVEWLRQEDPYDRDLRRLEHYLRAYASDEGAQEDPVEP